MAEEYKVPLTAAEIEKILRFSVLFISQTLSDAEKAQARENIGAGTPESELKIIAFFDTYEELEQTITDPKPGIPYGVGLTYPYDIYWWDDLHQHWVNTGPIKGADGKDGKDGSDAFVTKENIEAALGYSPASTTFVIILAASEWGDNKQSITNANFEADGFAYIVSPASSSFIAYAEAGIYADDVTSDGSMVFHATNPPTVDLTVNIVRMVST